MYSHEGELIHIIKQQDFTKVNLREYLRSNECSDINKTKLPIQTSKVCKVVGVYKGPYRRLKNRVKYGTNWTAVNSIRKFDNTFTLNKTRVFPGSWEYNSLNLRQMATPKENEYTVKQLIDGYFSRIHIDFKLPYIDYYNPDIINGLRVKLNAFPGLMTSIMFGVKRGVTTPYTKPVAIEYIKKVIRKVNNFYDFSLSAIGGREKRIDLNPSLKWKEVRTRIVIMGEDIPMLIGSSISRPITKAFQRLNDGFCYVGRSLEQMNYYDIIEKCKGDNINTVSCNSDFSNHDAHVGHTQLIVAFGILRLIFPPQWRFMDKLFYYCASGLIYKFIVLPESKLIYRISKGIATGHAFTSLINTVCAYGVFATAINETCTKEEINQTYLFVAGDDIICKLPLNKVHWINNNIQTQSGMKIDNLQDHVGLILTTDPTIQNSFLKRVFSLDGVAWNAPELYDGLISSPSGLKNTIGEAKRVIEMVMQGPNNQMINNIMNDFLKEILNYNYLTNDTPTYDFLHLVMGLDPPEILKFIESIDGDPFLQDNDKKFSNSILINKYSRIFQNRVRLANRWFISRQNFPLYGKKDDNYWIELTKVLTVPRILQNRHEFWNIVDRFSSLRYVSTAS